MADETTQPLLDGGSRSSSPHRPSSSTRSLYPQSERRTRPFELSSESTPLLIRRDDELHSYGTEPRDSSPPESPNASPESSTKRKGPIGPIPIAILVLSSIAVVLLFLFLTPPVVKEYASEAVVFHPANLSVDSASADGVRTQVQGDLVLDGSRVRRGTIRNLGRFVTWIAREVETGESEVQVFLPEYGNALVGTASLPSFKVNIRNGHVNHVDFLTDLTAGDIQGARTVAVDWLDGRLSHLLVHSEATVRLKSGLLNLGNQFLSETLVLEGKDFPDLPNVNITKMSVYDMDSPAGRGALAVDLSLTAMIDAAFALRVPQLGFEVLIPNCSPGDPYISIADAKTEVIQIDPGHPTNMDVSGLIRGLSDELTATCPGKKHSPLDFLVKSYMDGNKTTIYVRGVGAPSLGTPAWMGDLLKNVTVPLPFTGHSLDNLVKNFTMSDVHFSLPNPFAAPGSPESQLRASAMVKVLVGVPKQMNFRVDVPRVRATAAVYYNGTQLGVLELHKWQKANSTMITDRDGSPTMSVQFPMKDAPLRVTNETVLAEILQILVFEGKPLNLSVAAAVDAEVSSGLGHFAVRDIPAKGKVHVKPPYSGVVGQLGPRVDTLALGPTTESSMLVKTTVNFTNPTKYSATVPLVEFVMLYNATAVARITARNVTVTPGENSGVPVDLLWNPLNSSGENGVRAGREMISQYISGFNTTVTIQSYRGTVPSLPKLGQAMSKLAVEVPIPKTPTPQLPGGDDDDGQPHFIQDATLHLLSSTADFTLSSPLSKTQIIVTSVEAIAFYEETEELGRINNQDPFEVPPGISLTPRLPVDLNLDGVGYSVLKKALGDTLQISAAAEIGVLVDQYKDLILYKGDGIGANIRI